MRAESSQIIDCVKKTRSDEFFLAVVSKGIGMFFREAMAIGKCVVANNDATMNEYIKNGETALVAKRGYYVPFIRKETLLPILFYTSASPKMQREKYRCSAGLK